jgi:hypothetical protein
MGSKYLNVLANEKGVSHHLPLQVSISPLWISKPSDMKIGNGAINEQNKKIYIHLFSQQICGYIVFKMCILLSLELILSVFKIAVNHFSIHVNKSDF